MAGNNIVSDKNKIFSPGRLNWKGATQLGSGCFAKVYRGLFATYCNNACCVSLPFYFKKDTGLSLFLLECGPLVWQLDYY